MNKCPFCYLHICLYLFLWSLPGFSQHITIIVEPSTNYIEGLVAPYNTLRGGDTLLFKGGNYPYLLIRNISGEPDNPVIMMNYNGSVVINTDHHFGISIEQCSYFRLTGTGTENELYGFRIEGVTNGGGIGVGHECTDFELDHIYIANVLVGGLYAKTDVDCSFKNTREKFTQYNTRIHDNYFANIGNEGMYVGSTKYFGQTVNCNGIDTLLLPSLLDGVYIYNNILNITGWDGIQVSSASSNCKIYDNLVMYDSEAEKFGQMSGIILGGGSKCDCYNNYIANGKGNGIESHGLGGYRIFNNVIENAGRTFKPFDTLQMKYGIYITDITVQADSSFFVLFNDIISPKSDGIRFLSTLSKNNKIFSNAIINPGNFDYYENGNFTVKGIDSYVMIPDPESDVMLRNNYFSRNTNDAAFYGISYSLTAESPLVDAGYDDNLHVFFDFYHHPRPYQGKFDIGAYEFNPDYLSVNPFPTAKRSIPVPVPNPAGTIVSFTCQVINNQPVTLWVIDFKGYTKVKKDVRPLHAGSLTVTAEISDLPDGAYLYRLLIDQKTFSGKFIKRQ